MKRMLTAVAATLCLTLASGCSEEDRWKEEIRRDVQAGRYEQATEKARDYFSADKLNLMVLLEYIAIERAKADKAAYKRHLLFNEIRWSQTRPGVLLITGTLSNSGNKILTGYGIKVTLILNGVSQKSVCFSRVARIPPGAEAPFRHETMVATDFDGVRLEILDFAFDAG